MKYIILELAMNKSHPKFISPENVSNCFYALKNL